MSENNIKVKIEKDSDKYKIVLKLINKILKNMGKDEIDDITKFTDIDREDIIKEANIKALNDMDGELFKHFNKKNCGYYRKTDALVLNCLRGMMKEAGFKLAKKQKGVCKEIDGKKYERTHMIYSIK